MTAPHHWPQVRPYGSQRRAVWPAGVAVSPYHLTETSRAILAAELMRIKAAVAHNRAKKEAIR